MITDEMTDETMITDEMTDEKTDEKSDEGDDDGEVEDVSLWAWRDYETAIEKLVQSQSEAEVRESREHWRICDGNELEPALATGAIALLDVKWLVNFALDGDEDFDDDDDDAAEKILPTLPRRQDLPSNAFSSLDQIRDSSDRNRLNVICLSYMWLQPDHPDPKGATLRLLARRCQTLLRNAFGMRQASWCRYAIFWDFASLHQKPRTIAEEELFQQGLNALSTFFSHKYTRAFQITKFPEGYPSGYDLPPGSNVAVYHERGWPFMENCLMDLGKRLQLRQDITNPQYRSYRKAPISPDQISKTLPMLSFTNGEIDRPLVMRLYRTVFVERFQRLVEMKYQNLGWDDGEVVRLARDVIGPGYCPNLRKLILSKNIFGVRGCEALDEALQNPQNGIQSPLEEINLTDNPGISDAGIQALANTLVKCKDVSISSCNVGVLGCQALVKAAKTLHPPVMETLSSGENPIGDAGAGVLVELVKLVPLLRWAWLGKCGITLQGRFALEAAARENQEIDFE